MKAAVLSECRQYRYSLTRIWDPGKGLVHFVMLNPSTADENDDDPTIRRCIGFAESWNAGGIHITNLFALRTPNPKELYMHASPISKDNLFENDSFIISGMNRSSITVFAWGAHGGLLDRDKAVIKLIPEAYCLGLTKSGKPKHPLYLAKNTNPIPFKSL